MKRDAPGDAPSGEAEAEPRASSVEGDPNASKLVFAQLSADVEQDTLSTLCCTFGAETVQVVHDPVSGVGTGHVSFASVEKARAARECLHGRWFIDAYLRVAPPGFPPPAKNFKSFPRLCSVGAPRGFHHANRRVPPLLVGGWPCLLNTSPAPRA